MSEETPIHASAELARLLPVLPDALHSVLFDSVDQSGTIVARACELLCADRARLTAELARAAGHRSVADRALDLTGAAIAERDAARAEVAAARGRVAELEAERLRVCRGLRIIIDGAAAFEAERSAELREKIVRTMGDIAREALTAPSPLDRAVAEVVAAVEAPEATGIGGIDDAAIELECIADEIGERITEGERGRPMRDKAVEIAAMALGLAVALGTCDAPAGPRCRHCSAPLGAPHVVNGVRCAYTIDAAEDHREDIVSAGACDAAPADGAKGGAP